MSSLVRILHVEDNLNDAALVQAMLEEAGLVCELVRVETHDDFAAALKRKGFDLIISDFTLPSFDGRMALKLARTMAPEVPFLFFSGTIGEERAVEALQDGATDYVLKQRPARLVPAVRRALHEVELRKEREQMERQLRQAQKMEAIGQFTTGIAHDFNNLLAVINGYGEMLLQALPAGDPHRDSIAQITEAGERAAGLTRQLLAFSRKQILESLVLDLNAIVAGMEQLLTRTLGENIHFVATLGPGLGRVKADPNQIEQVLMNLAGNARDAMPQGGTLTIATMNVDLDKNFALTHALALQPGPFVMLAVSDTGCGMDEETQRHIFEPFFTTKGPGKGTGLGLATVYGIVKQSGGYIWVYSDAGRGTTFKIYLPRVTAAIETRKPRQQAARPVRGSETVLLAEDDAALRVLIRRILQSNGYTVLEAHHGKHALEVSGQHAGPVHLLLADVIMPEMGGTEAARLLSSARPDMKVLFLSGHADEAIDLNGILASGAAFLPKPFTPNSLLHKLREVLDARGKETT